MVEEVSTWFINGMNDFLKKRKNIDTALDARTLLAVVAQAQQTNDGWIRAKDLRKTLKEKNFGSPRTLTRFLKDLETAGLIIRQERIEKTPKSKPDKRKPNVYYQLCSKSVPNPTLERMLVLEKYQIVNRISRRESELHVAKILLKELGIPDPTAAIYKRMKEEGDLIDFKDVWND